MIPLPSTILALICGADWFAYGLLVEDAAIMIPNGLGVIFSIINLTVYFIFRKKIKDENNLKSTVTTTESKELKSSSENIEKENFEVKEKNIEKEKIEVKEEITEKIKVEVKEEITEKEKVEVDQSQKSEQLDNVIIELDANVVRDMKNTL